MPFCIATAYRITWLKLAGLLIAGLTVSSLCAENSALGLLFYLSADHGTTADFSAGGTPEPTFDSEVTAIPDGASGPALSCGNFQRLAWSASGNIYAQRGTLSFAWRAREPVGPTEFPIFRVGYADHSSWDMTWLRIDYNGHGFDAFVTDASLARTRVSVSRQPFPVASEWIHLALSWDETIGIRFYVNGRLVAQQNRTAVYDAGLDQFGPHSRIISPYQVQSDYNFTRGGDVDEIRIYDHMLADQEIAALTGTPIAQKPSAISEAKPAARSLAQPAVRAEWALRQGWNRDDAPPPELLESPTVAIRKVEISDAYDQKRWWWKATDGIRETTWPGVYNRSRLPGRNDYFQLPDWDCYSTSGKAITFTLPDEPWNWLELSGAAWGKMTFREHGQESLLFERPQGAERTVHRVALHRGGEITFTNVEQEEPIGELVAYHVGPGTEPTNSEILVYHLFAGRTDEPALAPINRFIAGRFAPEERTTLMAQPADSAPAPAAASLRPSLPIVHVVIPDTWDSRSDGLDGIAVDLPAIPIVNGSDRLIALRVRVADPLWPARALFDFTCRITRGQDHRLWLDLRDRMLPRGQPLFLTFASDEPEFGPAQLARTELRLHFKARELCRAEHELDRFTQVRDAYAMLVEEHPNSPKLKLWVRFKGDLEDLLRVNPEHALGRRYAAAAMPDAPRPPFTLPEAPTGTPTWAFRQAELLGRVKRFVTWYIDHRQIENGELGGGLSDDTDLTNMWPGVALMGCEPEKLAESVRRVLDACYTQGMFTNGLPTIQADELHSYEEGINCLAQNLILDYGSPRQLERAMATARGVQSVTGINAAGHRHIRSSYYSGKKLAEEGPWGWSKPYSYLVLHPVYLLAEYNGNPAARKLVLELADGLLAHYRPGTTRDGLPASIHFATDVEGEAARNSLPWPLFWSSWRYTGDRRYLAPLLAGNLTTLSPVNANVVDLLDLRADWTKRLASGETAGPTELRRGTDGRRRSTESAFRASTPTHLAWQLSGDKTILEKLYAQQIEQCDLLEYINTEGSLWIDRVGVPYADLQRARLGGIALTRNGLIPGHAVSWKFDAPANDQSVAILVPTATQTGLKIIAHNLESTPVTATITGWDVAPGEWQVTQGTDTNDDDVAETNELPERTERFERTRSLHITLPPHATTILGLKLVSPGTPYSARPDLGLDREDVTRVPDGLAIRVHNIGSIPSSATTVVVRDRSGRELGRGSVPALLPPIDLQPKTADTLIRLANDVSLEGASIELNPDGALEEITARNNSVRW
ncbi:MAG: LamG-like jellyroll fold domain-containing protein [Opitutus sp.]